ncbi:hypothetical protein [Tianweitania sediminis]|uniref:Uncharacterized protein n=1 Tax=Tianweitania sediminis TaxID=1502156 RepID=A0A8J7UIP2_9HYPH|nr:hypothetical protein [Tianweitania sediminis]MBP0439128.1 hypothetical protein [Tianweitania sediminis]
MRIDAARIMAEAKLKGGLRDNDLRLLREYASRPAPEEDVRPSLRFLLSPEAIAQGQAFVAQMHRTSLWGSGPNSNFVERIVVPMVQERWPLVAAADAAMGGVILDVIRKALRMQGQLAFWEDAARGLAIGHPQRVEEACRRLLDRKSDAHGAFAEEAPDAHMMKASGDFADRDLTDDEALQSSASKAPPAPANPFRRPRAPVADDLPASGKVLESSDDIPF